MDAARRLIGAPMDGSPRPMRPSLTTRLTGWGRTAPVMGRVVEVTAADAPAVVSEADHRGLIARGLGRSYGDAAQNAGGRALRLRDATGGLELDPVAGTVTVGAGLDIDQLLRVIVPSGFFVPVTPGTRFVTIGGAIASDIHGKNHHVDGSFGRHVRRMSLLLADGTVTEISPDSDPELFWATVGGMGLTGVILDATVSLLPIETSRLAVETRRVTDLDTLLTLMSEGDHLYRYSVAWIDLMATGRSLGRSVLTWGDHARLDQLDERAAADPLAFDARQLVTVPPLVPTPGVVNRLTAGVFNEFWYRSTPRHRVDEIQTIPAYFHPLDAVGSWNRLYGRRGFVQYQFMVPFGAEEALRTVVERIAASGASTSLNVLKRFGAANPAPLSFPRAGWTLTLDLPASWRPMADLMHELDRLVLDAGGRHYLSKDAVTTADSIRRGYPRLREWQAVQRRVDPNGRWQSDLARRLELVGPTRTEHE
jgi:decaprenylphospho-beta-D-ribofuranose 2-oxidase